MPTPSRPTPDRHHRRDPDLATFTTQTRDARDAALAMPVIQRDTRFATRTSRPSPLGQTRRELPFTTSARREMRARSPPAHRVPQLLSPLQPRDPSPEAPLTHTVTNANQAHRTEPPNRAKPTEPNHRAKPTERDHRTAPTEPGAYRTGPIEPRRVYRLPRSPHPSAPTGRFLMSGGYPPGTTLPRRYPQPPAHPSPFPGSAGTAAISARRFIVRGIHRPNAPSA